MKAKPDCKDHPLTVEKYDGTLRELANDIGDLRYDELAVFLKELNDKFLNDSNKDWAGGRRELSTELNRASILLGKSVRPITRAWRICKAYMTPPTK